MQTVPTPFDNAHAPGVTITSMQTSDDALAFKNLNEEWITEMFTLVAADRAILEDPFGSIVAHGGDVLVAREGDDADVLGGRIVGCVAVVPTSAGAFELSKMTVAADARNRGIGRQLIHAAIDRARALGAPSLFLGSSTKLSSAVHLYEATGFSRVGIERIGPMPYARADVYMELVL